MEKEIIKRWDENKHLLKKHFSEIEEYDDYLSIVKAIFKYVINDGDELEFNIEEITEIDNGDYQGTKLFLIHKDVYQPDDDDYVVTSVGYGSCTVCDTLERINILSNADEKVSEYMTLSLHIVQRMKWVFKEMRKARINKTGKVVVLAHADFSKGGLCSYVDEKGELIFISNEELNFKVIKIPPIVKKI